MNGNVDSQAPAPKATIVVTTKDRTTLARRAIASALAQATETGQVEVIVVDDGSTPPFEPDIEDPRLQLIRNQESRGPAAARNQGLNAAEGDWVMFLDDDDVILPGMIEASITAAATSELPPPVSVLSAMEVVDDEGTVLETRTPPTLSRGRHYFLEDVPAESSLQTHNTLVMPVDVAHEIGGWDEALPASEHDDFFLRLNLASSIQGIPRVTYRLTAHPGERLSKAVLARAIGMERTAMKHRDIFEEHRRLYARYVGASGITFLRAGLWWRAVRATSRSVWIDPFSPRGYWWWLVSLAGPWPLEVRRRLLGRRE